jgi:hypothetical protein
MIRRNIQICLLGLTTLVYSCHPKNQIMDTKWYYILYSGRGSGIDTLNYDSVNKKQPGTDNSNVIDSFYFNYKKKYINIKKLSNYPNAPIDGEYVAYWEKSLGYFYSRSTTWRNFVVLKTNSDTINDFINVLLGAVLLDPQFSTNPAVNYKELLDLKMKSNSQKYKFPEINVK